MSCQQVPTTPAFNLYPRSVQVGEFEVAIDGGIWVALSMEDAQRLQRDICKTETEQRRQRQDIFAVEDEIEARRDALIAALQKRLHRASRNQSLFVVRWSVV